MENLLGQDKHAFQFEITDRCKYFPFLFFEDYQNACKMFPFPQMRDILEHLSHPSGMETTKYTAYHLIGGFGRRDFWTPSQGQLLPSDRAFLFEHSGQIPV